MPRRTCFINANRGRNIHRLMEMGFAFEEQRSSFYMRGEMRKRRKKYVVELFFRDGFVIVSDSTQDAKDPNFLAEVCRTWSDVLDSLVRRRALTEKQRLAYEDRKP